MEPQARWFKPCGIHYQKDFRGWSWTDMLNHLHAALGFEGQACPAQRRQRRKRHARHRSLLRLTRQLRTIRSRMRPELSSRLQAFKSTDSAKKSCALVDGENLRNIQQYSLENSLNWALDAENPAVNPGKVVTRQRRV